jgi:hypothetical protein
MSVQIAASYKLAILGYVAGMTFSALGEMPIGLLLITAASLVAATLFIAQRRAS